jgi:hypothetical protein
MLGFLSISALITWAPMSSGLLAERVPAYFPIAVLTASITYIDWLILWSKTTILSNINDENIYYNILN